MSVTHGIPRTGHEPSEPPDPKAPFSRLAAFSARHRRGVIAVWMLVAFAAAPLTVDDVLATIEDLGSLAGVLSTAEPNDRAQLYEALGMAATYDANARTAVLEVALPRSANNVSEGRHTP